MPGRATEAVPVTLFVDPEHLKTVVGRLADLVASEHVVLTWNEPDGSQRELLPRYKLGRVTWFMDPETTEPVALVTRKNLHAFADELDAEQEGANYGNASERLFNRLGRYTPFGIVPFIFTHEDTMHGFRAEGLSELVLGFQNQELRLSGVGPKAIDLLAAYSQDLLEVTSREPDLTTRP